MTLFSSADRRHAGVCLLLALCALCGGCSTPASPAASCGTLNCLLADVAEPYIDQCMKDLFRHDRMSSVAQARINKRYGYPLTNSSTYYVMQRSGAIGPSPKDWCTAYGNRITALRFPTQTSPAAAIRRPAAQSSMRQP